MQDIIDQPLSMSAETSALVASAERASGWAGEPLLHAEEDPEQVLAPGTARRRALDDALSEIDAGQSNPSSDWKVRYALMTSTVVGVLGLGALYEAGEHGGEIVYAYAGGVGTRSGNPQDISHLLRAGLYQQAIADRKAGRADGAAALLDIAAQRFPNDVEVLLARAESLLIDRKNAMAALDALRAIMPPADNRAVRIRHGMLTADALVSAGQREGAIATLQQLIAAVPSPRVQQRLDALKAGGSTSGK